MSGLKQKFLPRDRAEWLYLIGLLIYALASLAKTKTSMKLPFITWADLEVLALTLTLSTLIISGLIGLRRKEKKVPTMRLLGGILGGIVLISYNIVALSMLQKSDRNLLSLDTTSRIALNKATSDDFRAYLRKEIAKLKYWNTGESEEYIDKNGGTRQFSPDAEDIKAWANVKYTRQTMQTLKAMSYFWGLIVISSAAIGLLVPIRIKSQD